MIVDRLRARSAAIVALVVSAGVIGLVIVALWQHHNLMWARNAHAMAEAGAWGGVDALWAYLVYWFLELHGRTVATALLLAGWLWAGWRSLR